MSRLLSFHGRSNRTEFWVVYFVLILVMWFLNYVCEYATENDSILLCVSVFVFLFVYYLNLAVCVRRSHDLGHNGWWIFIPFYNFFWLGFAKGEDEANEYGEPVKEWSR